VFICVHLRRFHLRHLRLRQAQEQVGGDTASVAADQLKMGFGSCSRRSFGLRLGVECGHSTGQDPSPHLCLSAPICGLFICVHLWPFICVICG
jgi:hypothetical protein